MRESKRAAVAEIVDGPLASNSFLVSNTSWDFRGCSAAVERIESQTVRISRETAGALQVREGDLIRYASPSRTEQSGR